jgi:hypothetical protein
MRTSNEHRIRVSNRIEVRPALPGAVDGYREDYP